MKTTVVNVVLVYVFTLQGYCDEYMGEFVEWYTSLEYYKFNPKIGNCYEIYDQNEKVTPLICQRPANSKKHSCIYLTRGANYCLALRTPTNEIVNLLCDDSQERLLSYHLDDELNNCFNISRFGKKDEEICQQTFGNYSIGITTTDNFTILFDSYFCSTSTSDKDRKTYNNFVNSFSFDPETKSCYKIYNEHQQISPYTCLNDEIHSTCVQELPHIGNCEGIITQNNETVVLHCREDNAAFFTNRCFKIYTANNTLHTTCQKKVEERCVGIITPSNLTVLLECYFCSKPGNKHVPYNKEQQKKYRAFLKTYLSCKNVNENSYINKTKFESFKLESSQVKGHLERRNTVYGYWLPNSNCYGVTLESNETIILECISQDIPTQQKPGCFQIVNSDVKINQQESVCIRILNETCVGITTPLNWSVALACYREPRNTTSEEMLKQKYAELSVEDFRLYPGLNNCYEVYHSDEITPYVCRRNANPKNYSCIHWIPGKKHCLGLHTPSNETIELVCGDTPEDTLTFNTFSQIKSCFNIFGSEKQQENICLQKFGNYSFVVTTPSNYSILFDSAFCSPTKTAEQLQNYKEFIGNFSFDPRIRSCYKIYKSDQDISPYTCLSDEIYEACIQLLDDGSCRGIKTQNNETIVLECPNDVTIANKTRCVKIYTSDNKEHSACPKQIEEQCVGIITPSNLTVLLECLHCQSTKGGSSLPVYTDEHRKNFRPFVEYAFYVLTQNNYALENETTLSVYTSEEDIKFSDCDNEVQIYEIHTLPEHNGCKGITLDNMETVVLSCANRVPEKIGCFDVFSLVYKDNKIVDTNNKVGNICVKLLNEWCVGITTPSNWTIPLSCYQYPTAVCSI